MSSPPQEPTEEAVFLLTTLNAAFLITKLVAGYTLVQGTSILIGGPERFGAPGYSIALIAPGAPWSWGVVLILSGLIMVCGVVKRHSRTVAVGAFTAAAWSMFFATAFAWAVMGNPLATNTGMWVYGKDAALFTVLGIVKWQQPTIPPRRVISNWHRSVLK